MWKCRGRKQLTLPVGGERSREGWVIIMWGLTGKALSSTLKKNEKRDTMAIQAMEVKCMVIYNQWEVCQYFNNWYSQSRCTGWISWMLVGKLKLPGLQFFFRVHHQSKLNLFILFSLSSNVEIKHQTFIELLEIDLYLRKKISPLWCCRFSQRCPTFGPQAVWGSGCLWMWLNTKS